MHLFTIFHMFFAKLFKHFSFLFFLPLCGLLFLCCLCLGLTGCSRAESDTSLPTLLEPLSRSDFLLNTIVTITLYDRGDEALIEECFELCREYEALFSRTAAESEINQINHASQFPVTVSPATAELLSLALSYSELSEGAFDLTVAPLTSLWDFTSLQPVRPSDQQIQEALRHIDYRIVQLDGLQVTLTDPNGAIDLGAIAKGYIADRLKEHLLSKGVESALLSLGGNILCIGGKAGANGKQDSFRIGIQKPFEDQSETVAAMELRDCSVVSSGIYERCFWQEDRFYHHLLNPATGYPYENGLVSVTIISPTSADGDALSTTCFALGLKEGMKLIDSLPDIYAVFLTEDEELHYSEGFLEHITLIP